MASKAPPGPPPMEMPQVDIGSIERRVRTVEESLTNLRKIVQVTEENIIVKNRHTNTEFKTLTSDLNELGREFHDFKEKFLFLLKEIQQLARRDDVRVIERYLHMWDPVKFVTHDEIEEIVHDILEQRSEKNE